MITALASEVHYLETLAPIWTALDPGLRTEFMVPDHLWDHARTLGVEPSGIRLGTSGIGLVASGRDLAAWDGPTILCEHGAGQSYQGDPASADHPAYAGGEGRENVILQFDPWTGDRLSTSSLECPYREQRGMRAHDLWEKPPGAAVWMRHG